MAEEFKLPGSSYEEVNKIIQGYATIEKAAPLEDVSRSIGMAKETISRNVKFLVAVGILNAGQHKSTTELGKSLGNALAWGHDENIRKHYAEVVSESEFLKSIVSAIRIRKGMDDSALRSHIAYSASAKKGASASTGTGTVIEVLRASGNIREEDGKYVVATLPSHQSIISNQLTSNQISDAVDTEFKPHQDLSRQRLSSQAFVAQSEGVSLQIKINVSVNCESHELDTLGEKLSKVIADLKIQDTENDHDEDDDREPVE